MRHRINDLTSKLSCSQRSLHQARHCLSRSQERRRSEPDRRHRSPATVAAPALPRDFGGTLHDLEQKIGTIQRLMHGVK